MRNARFFFATGLVFLGLAACHKSGSSSSGSGSLSGAVGNLATFAISSSGTTPAEIAANKTLPMTIRPKSWNPCMGLASSTTVSDYSSCPNPTTDTGWIIGGTVNMSLSSCTTGGYTFNGGLKLNFTTPETICVTNANTIDYLIGTMALTSPNASNAYISIAGNGLVLQSTCSLNIPLTLGTSNGAANGTSSSGATACGNPVSVTVQ